MKKNSTFLRKHSFVCLRNLVPAFCVLAVSIAFSQPTEAQELHDLKYESEFIRVFFDRGSQAYSSSDVNSMSKGYRFDRRSFTLWGADHKACPTWWWWGNSESSSVDAKRKLVAKISAILSGFPKETISKCQKVSPIILKGNVTNHWRNKEASWTTLGAVALKDIKTQKTTLFRALVNFDTFDPQGNGQAYLYNDTLQQVCHFRQVNIRENTATAKCGGLGSGRAVVEGDARSATFYLNTGKAVVFAVLNSTMNKAKRKYPDIFVD